MNGRQYEQRLREIAAALLVAEVSRHDSGGLVALSDANVDAALELAAGLMARAHEVASGGIEPTRAPTFDELAADWKEAWEPLRFKNGTINPEMCSRCEGTGLEQSPGERTVTCTSCKGRGCLESVGQTAE